MPNHLALKDRLLQTFSNGLPYRPYCTDDFTFGLRIHGKGYASTMPYIQHNEPAKLRWLVFDIDRPIGIWNWKSEWSNVGVPYPNMIVRDPFNKHAHLFYLLKEPVTISRGGRIKPVKYAAHVESGLCELLRADRGYSGKISKNPLSPVWDVDYITDHAYELSELEDAIPDETFIRAKAKTETYGLGRNCALFELTRQWGYRAYRDRGYSDVGWEELVIEKAMVYNMELPQSLLDNEVKHIARSVAKWIASNFNESDFQRLQSERGSRKGGKLRETYLHRVIFLAQAGKTIPAIAEELGLATTTIRRWLSQQEQ